MYNNEEWGDMKERIKEIVEEYKNELIVLGDFNARIGEVGGNDEEGWERSRESKYKTINRGGRQFLDLIGDIGGYILNGTMNGDWNSKYVSDRGCSVIGYVVVNESCYNIVSRFKIEDRVDSEEEEENRTEEEEEKKERRSKIS